MRIFHRPEVGHFWEDHKYTGAALDIQNHKVANEVETGYTVVNKGKGIVRKAVAAHRGWSHMGGKVRMPGEGIGTLVAQEVLAVALLSVESMPGETLTLTQTPMPKLKEAVVQVWCNGEACNRIPDKENA